MIESVQFSGYTPLLNISLNNLAKRSSTTFDAFLNISPIIPSGPGALPFLRYY